MPGVRVQQVFTQSDDAACNVNAGLLWRQVREVDGFSKRDRRCDHQLAGIQQLRDHLPELRQSVPVQLLAAQPGKAVTRPMLRYDP